MTGDLLIAWSARIAILFYFLRLAADILMASSQRQEFWARLAWTVGCAVYLVHVVFAFHFALGWSHMAALEHAARRTVETVGTSFPSGMYVNYVFTLLWLADVTLWWRRAAKNEPTPPMLYWSIQAVFAFMVFNATVVFGPPFWRWAVAVAVVSLIGARILLRQASDLPCTADEASRST